MASVNKAIIIGNLGRDPELRYAPSGDAICNITVATTETWKDKQSGEKKEATEWHRIVMFSKLAEVAGKYLKKGSQVYIEGKLNTRKWQDKDGQERYTTEIRADHMTMLGGKSEGASAPQEPRQPAAKSQQAAPQSSGGAFGDFSDDVPFLPIGRGLSVHVI